MLFAVSKIIQTSVLFRKRNNMHIFSVVERLIVRQSHIGAVFACLALSVFAAPTSASTISGAEVNVHVASDSGGGLVFYENAGQAIISDNVEYPDYWVASHDIDEIPRGFGEIPFQTDNSPLASQAQFFDCCIFNGFVYEFPALNIISASLSITNKPEVITDSRVVLFSPNLVGLDVSGLSWVFFDAEPLIVTIEFQTVVPIPATVWLFGFGLIGLIGIARRSKA
jgi:hypothetical protein